MHVSKRYPGVLALDDVDLELRAGEIHALCGENGSGKSTLARILYGATRPDGGVIEVHGKPVTFGSPRDALQRGIGAISQELTLAPTLSVAENVLMGRLPCHAGLVDWSAMREQARLALEQLGVHVDLGATVGSLPLELQQEIEIARALSANSQVLILDEATSSLSESATEALLEKIKHLRSAGVAILFISHRLRELYMCADRATILRDGKLVGTVGLDEVHEGDLVRMMVGREIGDLYHKRDKQHGRPRIQVVDVSTRTGSVKGATFEVKAGEVVGIGGLVGCGKADLALALAGAIPSSGDIYIDGVATDITSPGGAIRAGICFVPEDRKLSALFLNRSLLENLSIARLRILSRLGVLNVIAERRSAEESMTRFDVRAPGLSTLVSSLSGGNQQKVVLGRWLSLNPRIVILAEPTRGIDVGAKSEIYKHVQNMASNGAAVLVISSELPELIGVADRVLVMFRGTIVRELEAPEATEDEITHLAMGGAPSRCPVR